MKMADEGTGLLISARARWGVQPVGSSEGIVKQQREPEHPRTLLAGEQRALFGQRRPALDLARALQPTWIAHGAVIIPAHPRPTAGRAARDTIRQGIPVCSGIGNR
jgi:hypothetical protein